MTPDTLEKYLYGCKLCNLIYKSSKKIEETEAKYNTKVTCYECGGKLELIGA